MIYDVIIVGAGPAGMTAAIYLTRAGKTVLLFEKLAAGGQAALTYSIDNYPGFEGGINGFDLSEKMRQQAEHFGANFEYDSVENISYDSSTKIYEITSGVGKKYQSKTVLIATGAKPKLLEVKGEDKFFGRGIGTCAVCDGNFYKGKPVAVIGGGSSALEESLYLADIVSKVYIIHRRDEFRAEPYIIDKVKKHPSIELILDSVVEEFIGEQKLSGCMVKNVKTSAVSQLDVDGVFLYVGSLPNTEWVDDIYKDEYGFLKVQLGNRVNDQGLFAAGDCCSGNHKQVVIACGEGASVSYSITEYLSNLD